MEKKSGCGTIRNIDYIYLINLDQRPERLEACRNELAPFLIFPERFPGIYGWSLSRALLNDVALKFESGMWRGRESVLYYPLNGEPPLSLYLNETCYGYRFISQWTSLGAVGCALSHLSVLQDAYDSGYQTIWVMEDDISVREDPSCLSGLIDDLDQLVGKEGWDILYTDYDYLKGIDEDKDLLSQLPMKWRPDLPGLDLSALLEHKPVNEKFVKIGSRMRAHSLIYRRSGMKKILDFYRDHNLFAPYDHELFFVPGIQTYVLNDRQIVTAFETTSDTHNHHF